jgi:hypothetical protein
LPKSSTLLLIDEVIFQRIPEDGGQAYTLDKSEKDNYFSRIGGSAKERGGTGTSFKITKIGTRHIGGDAGDRERGRGENKVNVLNNVPISNRIWICKPGFFPKAIFSLTVHELKSIFFKVVSVCSPVNPTT